jgi:signal peptidase I
MTARPFFRTRRRLRRNWVFSTLVMVLVVGGFRSAVADWHDVPTGSMRPTILIGDRIVVNKLAYDLKLPFTRVRVLTWAAPSRGEIVTCYSPVDGARLVKRVVAVPGDTLAMHGSRLFINGRPLAYAPLPEPLAEAARDDLPTANLWLEDLSGRAHAVAISPAVEAIRDFGPVAVPAGKFFMMGDNRDNSGDSRHFGFVDRGAIAGRVIGVALSLDHEDSWRPRWSRFGHHLI